MADNRRGDSPLAFVVIRGALWGIVAAVIAIIMTEILGVIATGGSSIGIPTFAGGVPGLATGLLAGIVVAVIAWTSVRRLPNDAWQKALSRVVGVASALVTFAVGLASMLWLQSGTGYMSTPLHWIMSIGMIVLGLCVPVAAFSVWAADKTYRGYSVRFGND